MTLQQFFDLLGENPIIILFYFIALPITAILTGVFSGVDGNKSPWKFLYCTLIYLACVPGIFSVTLNIYFFLFERQSVLDTNLYTQVLPILSMIITLVIIQKNVNLDEIPGFDRMTGLVVIIACLLTAMWVLDRTHIIAITFMPFYYVVLLFIGLLFLIRFAWKKVLG
jgi:hypothetical protein